MTKSFDTIREEISRNPERRARVEKMMKEQLALQKGKVEDEAEAGVVGEDFDDYVARLRQEKP